MTFKLAVPALFAVLTVGCSDGAPAFESAPIETNDQKALQVRATLRPFPNANAARGLRVTGFYDADHYTADAERRRASGLPTSTIRLPRGG